MKKVDTYQCDFCNFQGEEEKVEEHEKQCMRNPSFKSCSTCVFQEIDWWNGNPWVSCSLKQQQHSNYDLDGKCPEHKLK